MSKVEMITVDGMAVFGPYSVATKAGGMVYLSGQLGVANGVLPPTIEEQTDNCMKNIGQILKAAGSDFNKVVKCQLFIKNLADFDKMNKVYASYFPTHKPARFCVEVSRLPKDALIEIDATAME